MDEQRGVGLPNGQQMSNLQRQTDLPLPFVVPHHDRMHVRICGRVPNTVLAVEAMAFTVRISEYTEPLSYGRFWCFETLGKALMGLAIYLNDHGLDEPCGWTRAIDFVGGYRVRKMFDGEIRNMEQEWNAWGVDYE